MIVNTEEKTTYLSIQDVADCLHVHYNTVYRWLNEGTLKGLRAGKQWRIKTTDLDDFLKTAKA